MFGAKYSRLKFWAISIGLMLLLTPIHMYETVAMHNESDVVSLNYIVNLILSIIFINTLTNRIRDYGSNPWIAAFALLPLINIILALYYGIVKYKKDVQNDNVQPLSNNAVVDNDIEILENNNQKFEVRFEIKDKNSWDNVKLKLLEFYKQYNIEKVISDKEKNWMLGSDTIKGYVQATLSDSVITVTSFKFPEPDMSIIKSEIKEDKTKKQTTKQTKMTSDANHIVDENILYEQVWDEIENNNKIKSLWSRAFANSNGNLEQTKALYIKYRVEDLKINKNTTSSSPIVTKEESDWDKKYARLEQEVRTESKTTPLM